MKAPRRAWFALLLAALLSNAAALVTAADRPRLAVLTDIGGDPDDQQSLIRLMVYANEFELELLLASASGTPGELKQAVTRPDLIRQIVDAYGEVRPNLLRHASGWPTVEQLRARIVSGNPQRGRAHIGAGHDTAGSRALIERIDAGDTARPLNLAIWGGQTDLAQALWRVKQDRGAAGLAAFVRKFRVYDINDQDRVAEWMRAEFPGMFYLLAHASPGRDKREGTYRGMYLTGDEALTSRAWIDEHVRSRGPLGALYPTKTWTAPNPHGCLKEGDTPSWFFFLPRGGNDPSDPTKPGWGGQYAREPDGWYRDLPAKPGFEPREAVSRWRPDFQRDFAARMRWCEPATAQAASAPAGVPWARHVIDGVGRGSDGTKLADINGDGWLDVTTGWEEEGETRVYLNPGPKGAVKQPWPKVVVGGTPDVEDAVFADLDGDGVPEVVSSSEGRTLRIYVHWAPRERNRILDASAWRQQELPAATGVTCWMFAEPLQLDGRNGVDLVAGSKRGPDGQGAWLGWFEAPAQARDLAAWRWHPLAEAGWIMSIELVDMDGDGDRDVLYSDRKGPTRGIHWLENPGPDAIARGVAPVRHSLLRAAAEQVMFLALGDVDGDGRQDIVAGIEVGAVTRDEPSRNSRIVWLRRLDGTGRNFAEQVIPVPANTGNIKGLAVGDIDGDGRADLVASCENAHGERRGLYWLKQDAKAAPAAWRAFDVSGAPGIKFDLVRLLDLDGDGDLDVLANDEQENRGGLGVVWYENPLR